MGVLQASEARREVLAGQAGLADLTGRVYRLETLVAKLMMLDLARSEAERDRSETERKAS